MVRGSSRMEACDASTEGYVRFGKCGVISGSDEGVYGEIVVDMERTTTKGRDSEVLSITITFRNQLRGPSERQKCHGRRKWKE